MEIKEYYESFLQTTMGREIYIQGANAAKAGRERGSNPWAASFPKRQYAWNRGYDSEMSRSGTITYTAYPAYPAAVNNSIITSPTMKAPTMSTLYETKDGKFVTKLATNSKNEWVVEERGTGAVFAVESSTLKKVIPYTVDVKFTGPGGAGTYSYMSAPDQVKVGDTLLNINGSMATVVKINTEAEHATTELKAQFRRIVTEELK